MRGALHHQAQHDSGRKSHAQAGEWMVDKIDFSLVLRTFCVALRIFQHLFRTTSEFLGFVNRGVFGVSSRRHNFVGNLLNSRFCVLGNISGCGTDDLNGFCDISLGFAWICVRIG